MTEKKISISIGRLQNMFGDMRAIEIAAEIGADAVDFDTCGNRWDYRDEKSIFSKSDEEIVAYCEALKKRADELGIIIGQTHGRIAGFRGDPAWDEAAVKNARLDCLVAKTLGAPVCIMHGVTTIHMGADADPQMMRDMNFNWFTSVLPFAKQYGIKLATETFGDATGLNCCDFFGNADEFIKSYNRICAVEDFADYFVMCMDTGHSHKATRFNNNPSSPDVIRMLGSKIVALHLNDNDTLTDQHKIPLTGSLDWEDILNALDEVGYNGTYNMELNLAWFGSELVVETAAFAIKVLRTMLQKHYAKKG